MCNLLESDDARRISARYVRRTSVTGALMALNRIEGVAGLPTLRHRRRDRQRRISGDKLVPWCPNVEIGGYERQRSAKIATSLELTIQIHPPSYVHEILINDHY
jgi:hypothetical protein